MLSAYKWIWLVLVILDLCSISQSNITNLLMSHGHIGYVLHKPIKHNHASSWVIAILYMCFISQSYTTVSYNEPWPYWICVSSANYTQSISWWAVAKWDMCFIRQSYTTNLLVSRDKMGYLLHQPIKHIMDFSSIIYRPIRNSILTF